jgi:hypothetical protein
MMWVSQQVQCTSRHAGEVEAKECQYELQAAQY